MLLRGEMSVRPRSSGAALCRAASQVQDRSLSDVPHHRTAIAVLASDGYHMLATRFFNGEYAISYGSESISLHNDDVHDARCRDEVVTSEKRCLI